MINKFSISCFQVTLRSLSIIFTSAVLRLPVKATSLPIVRGVSASSTMMKPSVDSCALSSNTGIFTAMLAPFLLPALNVIALVVLSKSCLPLYSSKMRKEHPVRLHRIRT